MSSNGWRPPPLYMVPVFFAVAALGVGGADFLVTHGSDLEASVVLGVGCGLIVVVLIWLGGGRNRFG